MTMGAKRVEIPMFPGGKRVAVTTSWDDGTIHDRRLVAAFNEMGIKGTFNLNSGFLGNVHAQAKAQYIEREEVAGLFAGHEVAIHTVTHPWLQKLDASQIALEVLEDRKALEDLVGYPVRGMAYPFGTYNAEVISVLRALGIVYCRTVENKWNPWPATEPLAWPATCHVVRPDPTPGEEFARWYDKGGQGLFFVWGHSYEFDRKLDWGQVETIFRPMAGKGDVWYCTNIELFDYEAARQRVVIGANRKTAYNPSAMSVWLSVDGALKEVKGGEVVVL